MKQCSICKAIKSFTFFNKGTCKGGWDNWSHTGWHIDHIIPLASFDLNDRQQFLEATHYTNLQPLWMEDNMRKSDRTDLQY